MKNIIMLLLALATVVTAFGREITGKVVGENESPLDYVNVVLYSDSIYITGTVTDSVGIFSVSTEANGNLTARISFVGYETLSMSVPSTGNLGVISLVPSVKQLGKVVVKATRQATTMKGNALVTNIEGSSLAIAGTDNRVDESNIAAFVEMAQQFGSLNIGVGLRYEHVKFDYYETGRLRDGQSKTYNNLFPSLNIAAQTGPVRMGLNYSGKTVRPGYGQLDGAVSYINRLTFETGNPYLKPTKMQTVEYMAQWRQFFAQLSYTYFKDGVYHITEPYGDDGEATIIRTANLDHRHYFQAFLGGQFKVGIWQPRVNVGVMKQWLTLPVNGRPMKMNNPGFLVQWMNAVHLPYDIWLNVDAQLMSRSWDNNMKLSNTPWHVNAKIYKGFLNNALSVTLEAKDLFNSSRRDMIMYSDAVQIVQKNFSTGRSVMLTLQYRFNTTRDRYRGTGAGNSERSRF